MARWSLPCHTSQQFAPPGRRPPLPNKIPSSFRVAKEGSTLLFLSHIPQLHPIFINFIIIFFLFFFLFSFSSPHYFPSSAVSIATAGGVTSTPLHPLFFIPFFFFLFYYYFIFVFQKAINPHRQSPPTSHCRLVIPSSFLSFSHSLTFPPHTWNLNYWTNMTYEFYLLIWNLS